MEVVIYSKPNCPYCTMAKNLAEMKGCNVTYLSLAEDYDFSTFKDKFPTARTFPQITVDGESIGGYTELEKILNSPDEFNDILN